MVYLIQKHLKTAFSTRKKIGITSLWEDWDDKHWRTSETKGKWKFVKNGNILLFGLQLENEERYCDGPKIKRLKGRYI